MTEHEQQAQALEREADEMQRRSGELGEDIKDARDDWEAKKADHGVPGAPSPEGGLPPEANYTTSGDKPPDDDGDPRDEPWEDE